MSIAVLGSGAWGTALASMLASGDESVILWGRDGETIDQINRLRRNPTYLDDIELSQGVGATLSLDEACAADVVLCVTPAQTLADLAQMAGPGLTPLGHPARTVWPLPPTPALE